MDLWIRSQDRQILKKINTEIYLKSGLSDYALGDVYFLVSGGTNLGEYKTKERALEVLDEIHQRLVNIQCIELAGVEYITSHMKRTGLDCVYEMPEE